MALLALCCFGVLALCCFGVLALWRFCYRGRQRTEPRPATYGADRCGAEGNCIRIIESETACSACARFSLATGGIRCHVAFSRSPSARGVCTACARWSWIDSSIGARLGTVECHKALQSSRNRRKLAPRRGLSDWARPESYKARGNAEKQGSRRGL